MSAMQPSLHKYFKVKKSLKDQGKANLSKGRQLGSSDDVKTKLSAETDISIAAESSSNLLKYGESEDKFKGDVSSGLEFKDNESPQEEEDENQSTTEENLSNKVGASKSTIQPSQLSVTPEKKDEKVEGPSRKRKWQQLEEDGSSQSDQTTPVDKKETPVSSKDKIGIEQKIPSAKKRLVLEEADIEKKIPEKLDPETIKKRLGKCGRLDELRSRLLKLNQCQEKIEVFKSQALKKSKLSSPLKPTATSPRKKDIKLASSPYKVPSRRIGGNRCVPSPRKLDELHFNHFSSLDIEVPVSPKKQSPAKIATPVKCRPSSSSLSTEPSDELYLPHRYQFVKEVFRAVDTVVSLLHNRQEVITFSKLKPAVQEMLRKTLSQTHLGQIKTVFPLAYFFAQEKLKSRSASNYNAMSYELTVKPNLEYKKDVPVARNLMQEMNDADRTCSKFRKMDSVVLVERRHIFHSALLDILKKHHDKFLQNLDPPINLDGPIRRWHPEFPIDDVPPPPPAPLPQAPSESSVDTAKDVLDKAKDVFSVNNRMRDAVTAAAKAGAADSVKAPLATQPQITDKSQIVAALRGVSLSLLEKIRAREADKAAREMTRSVGACQELEMLSRLPELARVLRNLFVTEKKAALPWDAVVTKVISSHSGSLSANETERHLNLLIKEVPQWCTRHKIGSGIYLKVDKRRQLQEVIDKLNTIIKEKT